MAAKNFKSNNPLDNFTPNNIPTNTPILEKKAEEKLNNTSSTKSKTVRSKKSEKKKDDKRVSILIPAESYEKFEDIKGCFGNNLTLYINKLIEKDLAANYSNYLNILKNLNSLM